MNDRKTLYQCLSIVAVLSGHAAMAETKVGADLSAGAGYATNPFRVTSTSEKGAAFGEVSLRPVVQITEATSNLSLSGLVSRTEYSHRYRGLTDYGADLAYSKTFSPLTSGSLRAGYSNRVSRAGNRVGDPVNDPDPTELEIAGRRFETIDGALDLSTTLSPRGSLTGSAFISHVDAQNSALSDRSYTRYGSSLGYSHAVSEILTVGANFSYSRNDYSDNLLGKTDQYTPTVNAQVRLTPRIRLSGSAGVTISKMKQIAGRFDRTSFFGSVDLCHEDERFMLCASAHRQVRPTISTGLSTVTGFGLDTSYKLSPRSTIRGNANYTRTDGFGFGLAPRRVGFRNAGVRYSRELTRRLTATAEANYTDPFGSTINRESNFTARVGVTYRLGRTQ